MNNLHPGDWIRIRSGGVEYGGVQVLRQIAWEVHRETAYRCKVPATGREFDVKASQVLGMDPDAPGRGDHPDHYPPRNPQPRKDIDG